MAGLTLLLAITLLVAASGEGLAVPLGLVAFSGIFCVQGIALNAALQATITSEARATITSVQGLVAELFALSAFVAFGVLANAGNNQLAAATVAGGIGLAAVAYGAGRDR